MDKKEFFNIVQYIVNQGKIIAINYSGETNLQIGYLDIFAKDETEKDTLLSIIEKLGKIVERPKTGLTFQLNNPLITDLGPLKLIKIRFPDPSRPQRGAPDFKVPDYEIFKKKMLGKKNVNLIERLKYEMIEIWDENEDVLVYFPNKLLSDDLSLNQ